MARQRIEWSEERRGSTAGHSLRVSLMEFPRPLDSCLYCRARTTLYNLLPSTHIINANEKHSLVSGQSALGILNSGRKWLACKRLLGLPKHSRPAGGGANSIACQGRRLILFNLL